MRYILIAGSVIMVLVCHSRAQGVLGAGREAVQLISYKNENYGQDGYEFAYETTDGTRREEKGSFVNGIWTVVGKSTWRDERGIEHTVVYIADDKGTRTEVMEGTPGGDYAGVPPPTGGEITSGAGVPPLSISAGALASLAG